MVTGPGWHIMFERFFRRDTAGAIKGLTLEWQCPDCAGLNFRILSRSDRAGGEYDSYCRYCRAKFRVLFEKHEEPRVRPSSWTSWMRRNSPRMRGPT